MDGRGWPDEGWQGSWDKAREVLTKYGLATEEQRGREVQLRLTERGWAVARLLLEVDSLLSSSTPSTTTSSSG